MDLQRREPQLAHSWAPVGGIGPGVNGCEFREVSVSFQIGVYVWGGGHG